MEVVDAVTFPFVVARRFSSQASFSAKVLSDMNVGQCHSLWDGGFVCGAFLLRLGSFIKWENTDAFLF